MKEKAGSTLTAKQAETLSVSEAIVARRTIKQFKTDKVSEQTILALLDTAVWAPTHGMRQPWRFIMFVDEGKKTLVEAITESALKTKDPERLLAIPAYVAVVMHEDCRQREWEEDLMASATLVQNFQLAAWEKGIGVKWLTEPYTFQPKFRKKIGVQPGEKLIGLLQVGYPETVPEGRERTSAANKMTIVRKYEQLS